jgi:hypothetical protein
LSNEKFKIPADMKSSGKTPLMLCFLLLNTFVLSAQPDFSGTWNLDHSKSDAAFRDYEVTVVITQTAQIFTVEQTLLMKSGEKSVMPAISYTLDGKESIKEEQGGKDKFSANWSPDKKTLTVKFVRTMEGKDYGSLTVYNLSDNSSILTVKSSDLTGESPMVQVYNKM